MLHVVLFEPEIPPNTGNIIRLCANTGARLHLIHPLGFELRDARLRRAGLDYHEWARVREYDDFQAFMAAIRPQRVLALTTKGRRFFHEAAFQTGDALLFGPETRGLPEQVIAQIPAPRRLRIPMLPQARSMNLSNAVAVVVYEVWRQLGFDGSV